MDDIGTEVAGTSEEKKDAVIKIEIEEGKWNYSWSRQGRTFRIEDRNNKDEWTKVIEDVKAYLEEIKGQDR